jgi:hypothetical protein
MLGACQGDGDRQQSAKDGNTPSYICDLGAAAVFLPSTGLGSCNLRPNEA